MWRDAITESTNQMPVNPRKFRASADFLLWELCERHEVYKSLSTLENPY